MCADGGAVWDDADALPAKKPEPRRHTTSLERVVRRGGLGGSADARARPERHAEPRKLVVQHARRVPPRRRRRVRVSRRRRQRLLLVHEHEVARPHALGLARRDDDGRKRMSVLSEGKKHF